MISPAEFIPVAEEAGLINEIGEWAHPFRFGTADFWNGWQAKEQERACAATRSA
jgi:EAL domain-containing protein (putative c-di-GMP-specific phosphodiesterase class I)